MFEAMVIGGCALLGVIVAAYALETQKPAAKNTRYKTVKRPVATRPARPAPLAPPRKPAPLRRPAAARPGAVRQAAPSGTGTHRAGTQDDLIAIVGFADKAYPILLPTPMSKPGIRQRVNQLTSPKYFRGGMTNLAAGMEQGLDYLERSQGRVRRLLVVSDGLPNIGEERLPALAERARDSHVSICSIYAGDGNAPVLQSMSDKTKGGWHTTARKMTDLAAAIRRAGDGAVGNWRSPRKGIIVVCIDMSGSMIGDLPNQPGVSRIEACKAAIHALLDHHAATYGVKVAA